MLRSILIGAAAAGLLIVGALTGLASNSHGTAVRQLATSSTLKGEARGDAVSALAKGAAQAATGATTTTPTTPQTTTPAKAETDVEAETETDTDTDTDTETDVDTDTENDTQGDAVSGMAKSEATAAHENDKHQSNHGGAVSEAAEKD
jgi:hypothetical protein